MPFPKTNLSEYTYKLPEEKIAFEPKESRSNSKLLSYKNGQVMHSIFSKLGEFLKPTDELIFNNAKVIPARLHFQKDTGAVIEVFLLEPKDKDYASLYATDSVIWNCLIGNKKRWKEGTISLKLNGIILHANWVDRENNTIEFTWESNTHFNTILDLAGKMPLPPYIKREAEEKDSVTYQTVYAKEDGAVAAPTAGLHFTQDVMNDLSNRGISSNELTLYVGAGTFKPVIVEDASEHDMHTEKFSISKELIEKLLQPKGRKVCVGTTSVRVLESLHWMGVKLLNQQHSPFLLGKEEAYSLPNTSTKLSLQAILDYMTTNKLDDLQAETGIFIVPGYTFKLVDVLITNFHQPGSTLIMLVAAFIGTDWKKVYKYALSNDFRFLSYGDSSILERNS